jgi:Protein of unknown function (DUF3619)
MNTDRKMTQDALGRQLAQALDDAALPSATLERLARARAAAVQAAAGQRQAQEAFVPAMAGGPKGSGGTPERGRWGWLGLAALLVAGLLLINHSQWMQQVLGVAEVDSALLKDQLPPTAYGDPGFNEYLDEQTEADPNTTPPAEEETDK